MTGRSRRGARSAAAAALVVPLAACGAPAQDGLGGGTSQVSTCVPLPGNGSVLFADEVLRNDGDEPVTVDAVRLVEADGLTLLVAHLLPVEDRTLLGTVPLPPDSPVWQQRRDAVGARILPGQTWNLALSLGREDRPGSFADVEVRSTADGDASTRRLAWALTVVPGACPEPPRT